jgi:predicted nucleic acid-binding protein
MTYALDSNAIIEILKDNAIVLKQRDNVLKQGNDIVIPVIADYEIWRGFYHRPAPKKERAYMSFCNLFSICKLTDGIWKCGARIYANLRNKGRTVDDFDILIAAMCIENGYTLVTHNTKHFDGIDDLLRVDWQDV